MKKRIVFLAAILALICLMAIGVSAAQRTVIDSGKCGDNITWTLYDDYELVIQGTGDMWDYEHGTIHNSCTAGWAKYRDDLIKLTIKEGITSIGDSAFWGCEFAGELVIPSSVKPIGVDAFGDVWGFSGDLVIPEGVVTIEPGAFAGSFFEENIIIGNSVVTIGEAAFAGLSYLNGNLTIGSKVQTIGDYAFAYNYEMSGTLVLPKSVKSIGNYAFSECSNLTGSLNIPNSVITIGDCAFEWCTGFTGQLIIPNSVTKLGESAFMCCSGFTGELVLSNHLSEISYDAFGGCEGITMVTIPDSVKTINGDAFSFCTGLTEIVVPATVKEIYGGVFCGCSSLKKVSFYSKTIEFYLTKTKYNSDYCDYIFESTHPDLKVYGYTPSTVMEFMLYHGFPFYTFEERQVLAFGHCGDDITITLYDDGECVVEGTGAMWDYDLYNSVGFEYYTDYYLDNIRIVLKEGITSIGDYAFSGWGGYGDLVIPNSVVSIGEGAFYDCDGFTGKLVIGNNVKTVGDYAFYGCSGFSEALTIGSSVESIGFRAFQYCDGFTGDLVIPNSVITIGDEAFSWCDGFEGCLILGEKVETIGSCAFDGCSGFTGNLIIPESVTTIGAGAFANCSGFTGELSLGGNVETIDYRAFYLCTGISGEVVIPDNVKTITEELFYGCTGIEEVTLSEFLENIEDSAFEGCSSLKKATIYTTDAAFGSSIFWNTHPDFTIYGYNVSTAHTYADANNHPFVALDGRGIIDSGKCGDNLTWTLYDDGELVIEGTGDMWDYGRRFDSELHRTITNAPWGYYTRQLETLTIHEGVTSIGDYAFDSCEELTGNLVFPSSITDIGAYAFDGCENLCGLLVFPELLTTIEPFAFYGCKGFTGGLTFPNLITEISDYVFAGCAGLYGDLIIPSHIKTIGEGAFRGCSSFNGELSISFGVTLIGDNAFQNCSGFAGDLIIPDSVISIGINAFALCSGFDGNLKLSSNLTVISSSAFSGCSSLKGNLILPESLTNIGNYAFYNCSGFSGDLVIPGKVKVINWSAFSNCTGFSGELEIPSSVQEIGDWAFMGCACITEVILPDKIETIGDKAFENCTSLKKATIYAKDAKYGTDVFYGTHADFTIYGYNVSTAHEYADANNHPFVPLDGCEHVWGEWSANTPKCDVYTDRTRTCIECGEMQIQLVDPIGHDYYITDTVDSTCTEDGYILFNCSRCPSTKTQIIIAKGHYYGDDDICDRCGHDRSTHAHTMVETVKAPTCTTVGYIAYRCECGYFYITEFEEQFGHKFDDGVITVAKTCYTDGLMTYTCVREGCTATITDIIPASHNWTETVIREETCTVDGEIERHCLDCKLKETVIIPAGHKWNEGVVTKEPTCTEPGKKTCTCQRCGETEEFEIPALGHNFVNGVCTRCGKKFIDTIKPDVDHPVYGMYFMVDDIYSAYGSSLIDEYGVLLDYNPDAELDKVAIYLTQDGTMWRRCIACVGDDITYATYVPYLAYEGEIKYTGQTSAMINVFPLSEESDGIWRYNNYATIGVNLEDRYGNLLLSLYDIGQAGKETRIFDDLEEMIAWLKGEVRYIIASGQCGDDLYWTLYDDGELVIEGTGDMWDYGYPSNIAPWNVYYDQLKTLSLSNEMTSIGKYAFYGCIGFTGNLVIPDSVETIGFDAFSYCNGFTGSLIIGNNVITIEGGAFVGCNGFKGNLIIGNSVKIIGTSAFNGCSGFTGDLVIPDNVEEIGDFAFYDCDGFSGILTIGDSVTSIGVWAFRGCSGFNGSLTLPNNIATIGEYAFTSCSGFAKAIIYTKTATFGTAVFTGTHPDFTIYGYNVSTAHEYADANNHPFVALDAYTLTGTVTSYGTETDEVTIELFTADSIEPAYSVKVTSNTATYTIEGVAPGTYTMKVCKKNHVTREYEIIVGDEDVTQDVEIHLVGDLDGNGKVNSRDWNAVRDHINKSATITDEYKFACADIDGNGKVNSRDWNAIRDHINKSNPLW